MAERRISRESSLETNGTMRDRTDEPAVNTYVDCVAFGCCFSCSSMEMKSNEGPALVLFGVVVGNVSATVGFVVRNKSCTAIGFIGSSLTGTGMVEEEVVAERFLEG